MTARKINCGPHAAYLLEDERCLWVTGDGILVKPDTPPEMTASGLIVYPQGSMEDVNNTGTILAFGTIALKDGRRIPIPGLEKGLKVAFVRFLADQHSNVQMQYHYEGIIRIKPTDVLVVYPAHEQNLLN